MASKDVSSSSSTSARSARPARYLQAQKVDESAHQCVDSTRIQHHNIMHNFPSHDANPRPVLFPFIRTWSCDLPRQNDIPTIINTHLHLQTVTLGNSLELLPDPLIGAFTRRYSRFSVFTVSFHPLGMMWMTMPGPRRRPLDGQVGDGWISGFTVLPSLCRRSSVMNGSSQFVLSSYGTIL